MPIVVKTPSDHRPERDYILQTVLGEFLGLEIQIQPEESLQEYLLCGPSGTVRIADGFFGRFPDQDLAYLAEENIPDAPIDLDLPGRDEPLPVLFGDAGVSIQETEITCQGDLFASAFFLLTRWEEFVLSDRQSNNRPVEQSLFCPKHGLAQRALVNEYVELLAEWIEHVGIEHRLGEREFELLLTHDVDRCYLTGWCELLGNLWKMTFQKKQGKKAAQILRSFLGYKLRWCNPFDSFDELMDTAEAVNTKAAFLFMPKEQGEPGFTYDVSEHRIGEIIKNIEQRGHRVGFHPSENTRHDTEQFLREHERIAAAATHPVTIGRNHGLFVEKDTFAQWVQAGCTHTSAWGLQNQTGFRCSCCYEFPVFDLFTRQTLPLRESPFIVMDTVVMRTKDSPDAFLSAIMDRAATVKKHRGVMVLNWHSNVINMREMKSYKPIYDRAVKHIGAL